MNNVLNRKMFVNRDARAKLANMGGILASSPEMVDETQRYAPGGTVTTDASGATGTFSVDPQPSFMQRLFEDLMRKIRNNEPFNDRDVQVYESLPTEVKQRINVNSAEGLDTTDNDRARRGPGRTAMDFSSNVGIMSAAPSVEAVNPALDDPTTKLDQTPQLDIGLSAFQLQELQKQRDAYQENLRKYQEDYQAPELASAEILSEPEIAPERINVNSAELLDTSDNDRARRGPGRTAMDFSTETIPTASVDNNEVSLMEIIDQKVAPAAKGNREDAISTIANFNEAEKQGAAMGAASEMFTPPSPYEEKMQKKEDDADRAERIAAEDEAFAQDVPPAPFVGEKNKGEVYEGDGKWTIEKFLEGSAGPSGLSSKKIGDEIEGSSNPSEDMANAVGDALGEDFEGMDMPERISSYKKILSDLLGTDTKEDKKEEFWMNMAMVGFAVAAGDDPSAIKNIADGLLAGSKMMKEDKASNQAREDKINMMALEESNKDKRLAARNRNAERVAQIRSTGSTSFATVDRMFKSVLDNALDGYKLQIEDGSISSAEAASQAIKIASESFPNSQFAIGNSGAESSEDNVPVVSTQADFDALKTGTVFLQKNDKGVFERREKK